MPDTPPSRTLAIASEGEYLTALDNLLQGMQRELCIFDSDLQRLNLEQPQRAGLLQAFLARGTLQRIAIVVHDPGPIERSQPRLINLLRRFAPAIEIRQSPENLRHLADCLVLADNRQAVIRFHTDHARGKALHDAPAEVHPYRQRFEELWELSAPCLSATVLGL